MKIRRILLMAPALLLAACAAAPERLVTSPTIAHVPIRELPDGHLAVLVRSHDDVWKLEGVERRVTVEYLWDYSASEARIRALDANSTVVLDETRPGLTLNATDEELAWAYSLAKADPAIVASLTADTDYYGGFSFRVPGHPQCDLGSRCIHVIASRDAGRHRVFHAIVDLQTARVVDPVYDPAMGGLDEPFRALE